MTETLEQLLVPNSTAKVSLQDITAYFFGGFLLALPFLPLPQVRFYFGVFTFFTYIGVFLTLVIVDLVKIWQMRSEIWQVQLLRIKILAREDVESLRYYGLVLKLSEKIKLQ